MALKKLVVLGVIGSGEFDCNIVWLHKSVFLNKHFFVSIAYALQMHNLQGGGLPKTPQMHDNFDGPDNDESSAPKPKYLDVYHYKDCLRHQHIGSWGHPYSHRN